MTEIPPGMNKPLPDPLPTEVVNALPYGAIYYHGVPFWPATRGQHDSWFVGSERLDPEAGEYGNVIEDGVSFFLFHQDGSFRRIECSDEDEWGLACYRDGEPGHDHE